jgi:predicted P-loop ATPase
LNLSSLQNVVPQLQGVWIYELAELDSLTLGKHQASEIKQFISNGSDDITQKFEKYVTGFKRKVVFAGTTNKSSYLRDETGARRFWPVVCTAIDSALLTDDREQLWAEAYEAWRNGEQWHLSPELEALAREEQEIRYLGDPWLSNIRAWLDPRSAHGKNGVSIQAILGDCLKVPIGKRTQGDMNRVVTCLQTLGWTHHERKRFPGGIREKRYMPVK